MFLQVFHFRAFFQIIIFWVDKLHKLDYLNVVRKIGLKSKSDQAMNNLMDNFKKQTKPIFVFSDGKNIKDRHRCLP
jgi:hypothetical protein